VPHYEFRSPSSLTLIHERDTPAAQSVLTSESVLNSEVFSIRTDRETLCRDVFVQSCIKSRDAMLPPGR
jgi:hypothetical protein